LRQLLWWLLLFVGVRCEVWRDGCVCVCVRRCCARTNSAPGQNCATPVASTSRTTAVFWAKTSRPTTKPRLPCRVKLRTRVKPRVEPLTRMRTSRQRSACPSSPPMHPSTSTGISPSTMRASVSRSTPADDPWSNQQRPATCESTTINSAHGRHQNQTWLRQNPTPRSCRPRLHSPFLRENLGSAPFRYFSPLSRQTYFHGTRRRTDTSPQQSFGQSRPGIRDLHGRRESMGGLILAVSGMVQASAAGQRLTKH
jgi:hypothetical protein